MKTNTVLKPFQAARYRVNLQGQITACCWSDWFKNPQVNFIGAGITGQTVIEGDLDDQSALFGLLSFVRDLGRPLISVELIKIL